MKQLVGFVVLVVVGCLELHTQQVEGNPFARLGYKADVYTFGEKKEFHDQEEIVEIGDILFNTKTNEVVGFSSNADSLIELRPELQSMSIDPHCEKYYSISPYVYCMNNPVKFIDPTGKTVVALDEESRRNILNTLTDRESEYIRFNKDGTLDTKKLNRSRSNSENFIALKTLANSETTYNFLVANEDFEGQSFTGENNNSFYYGLTAIPGEENKSSPDDKVWIFTSSFLNESKQAENVAHEGYGHAFFYELNKYDKSIDYQHRYINRVGKPEWDQEMNMYISPLIRVDSNERLLQQIQTTTQQARRNYEYRKNR